MLDRHLNSFGTLGTGLEIWQLPIVVVPPKPNRLCASKLIGRWHAFPYTSCRSTPEGVLSAVRKAHVHHLVCRPGSTVFSTYGPFKDTLVIAGNEFQDHYDSSRGTKSARREILGLCNDSGTWWGASRFNILTVVNGHENIFVPSQFLEEEKPSEQSRLASFWLKEILEERILDAFIREDEWSILLEKNGVIWSGYLEKLLYESPVKTGMDQEKTPNPFDSGGDELRHKLVSSHLCNIFSRRERQFSKEFPKTEKSSMKDSTGLFNMSVPGRGSRTGVEDVFRSNKFESISVKFAFGIAGRGKGEGEGRREGGEEAGSLMSYWLIAGGLNEKNQEVEFDLRPSEGEEPEDQGRIIQDIDDDPLVSLVRESMKEKSTDFVTPTKASGEAQEEEISPTILEAAKTLSKVASQSVSKAKSTDKGKRYRRRARSMAKNINTGLDAEDEINTGRVEINTGIEDVNTGSTKVDTGRTSISTSSIILSPKKGQREGKAQMVEEDIQATHKTKEQIRQEEAGLEEAIRLQAQMDEEVAKQIHLDKMVAKRVQEEQELSEQQLKRKAEVQEAAQFYTEEDWDTIRAKLEANTEVVKSLQGESISNDDFAKRMVEMINEKKKFYAEQKAKAKRSKPMTQAQQREYMSTFIKNQSSWKLSQLKKLSFEELKTEFEKLMKSIESFVPMETEARVKRHGLQLEQETSKKQKIDIEDASITKGKDEVVKEEEAEVPVKKTGKRRKQKARKGINIAKTAQDEFNNEREAFVKDKVKDASSESEIGVYAIPTATKPPTIVNWKIISQSSQKAAYHIIRRDGSDKIYMSFGDILKDFSRDDLIELYRLVIKKYGANRPEEMYDRILWGDLKTMFDPPLSDDAIWSLLIRGDLLLKTYVYININKLKDENPRDQVNRKQYRETPGRYVPTRLEMENRETIDDLC
ncbi:hypothetical protein Tco_0597449 [Tanacetum coccineum]